MRKGLRVSIFPAVAALAALFIVLPQRGADATIEMVGSTGAWRFQPAGPLRVDPGDRVAFSNDSRVTHTATCVATGDQTGACPWDSGDVQPGQTVFVTLPDDEALYTFACRYHGRQLQMAGTIDTTAGSGTSPAPSPVAS
jgi:plastocyanin